MVQCIINIILLYSPHNLLCSAAWPAERVTVCGWLVVCWQRQVQRCSSTQQCQLQLWTGALLITTTMALKLITLALTALVLVQVGHYSYYSHSNLQYKRPLCEEN